MTDITTASPPGAAAATGNVLSVRDLRTAFRAGEGWTQIVKGISFDIAARETVAVVGSPARARASPRSRSCASSPPVRAASKAR